MSSSNLGTVVSTNLGIALTGVSVDAASETYHAGYDPATTPPSMAVVALLAEALDTSPIEMDQLQHSIDTEALDAVLAAGVDAAVEISFTFEAYDITVTGDEPVVEATPHQEAVAEK